MSEQMYYHTITGKIDALDHFDETEHSDIVKIHSTKCMATTLRSDIECVACGNIIKEGNDLLASFLYDAEGGEIAHVDHLCIEC